MTVRGRLRRTPVSPVTSPTQRWRTGPPTVQVIVSVVAPGPAAVAYDACTRLRDQVVRLITVHGTGESHSTAVETFTDPDGQRTARVVLTARCAADTLLAIQAHTRPTGVRIQVQPLP